MAGSRTYGTLELFELYWVDGIPVTQLSQHPPERGIPTRTQEEGRKLREGEISIEELRERHLTEFQQNIVQELLAMQRKDAYEEYREMNE